MKEALLSIPLEDRRWAVLLPHLQRLLGEKATVDNLVRIRKEIDAACGSEPVGEPVMVDRCIRMDYGLPSEESTQGCIEFDVFGHFFICTVMGRAALRMPRGMMPGVPREMTVHLRF